MSSPVLSAPDFTKLFKLTVDASNVGICIAFFLQGLYSPVAKYFGTSLKYEYE
jgi:hypothetical protein